MTLCGHSGPVRRVMFSVSGRYLGTASDDHTAQIWKRNATGTGPSALLRSELGTAAGNALAQALGLQQVGEVWNALHVPKRCAYSTPAPTETPTSAPTPSPTVAPTGAVTFAPTPTPRPGQTPAPTPRTGPFPVTTYAGHKGSIHSIAWSPNGRLLATASRDSSVKIWEVDSNVEFPRFARSIFSIECPPIPEDPWEAHNYFCAAHESTIWDVAFSADGSVLATVGEDGARLWDAGDYLS